MDNMHCDYINCNGTVKVIVMGHYTRFYFKAKLISGLPINIRDLLNKVINKHDLGLKEGQVMFYSKDVFKPEFDHPFFKCSRWYMLFLSDNFDDSLKGGSFKPVKKYWELEIETEFKNYDNEIYHFIDWVSPYVAGRKKKQYVGYYRTEIQDKEINIYIQRE